MSIMAAGMVKVDLLTWERDISASLCAEDAVVDLVKLLKWQPTVAPLFSLRTNKDEWLLPNKVLNDLQKSQLPLQLRLRFKVIK